MSARTVMPSVTLPCHTSMLRGVDVPRHGITTNIFQPLARPVPSLFDVARHHGKRCAFFYNWGHLRDLHDPESVLFSYYVRDSDSADGDRKVTDAAIAHMREHDLDFAMVYLGWTDQCGHDHGWMSKEYIQAISDADVCVGRILDALKEQRKEPNVLVQSDHGGHDRSHGTEMDEDMTIPWILSGPATKQGHALETPVRIFDTCVTLAHLLGLEKAPQWEGKVIEEAFSMS